MAAYPRGNNDWQQPPPQLGYQSYAPMSDSMSQGFGGLSDFNPQTGLDFGSSFAGGLEPPHQQQSRLGSKSIKNLGVVPAEERADLYKGTELMMLEEVCPKLRECYGKHERAFKDYDVAKEYKGLIQKDWGDQLRPKVGQAVKRIMDTNKKPLKFTSEPIG